MKILVINCGSSSLKYQLDVYKRQAMNRTIITVVGKDTVGIIARICTYLADNKVNILDISQTRCV